MAACINATNMFGRAEQRTYSSSMFRNAIRHMKQAIRDGGYLLIAEPYYHTADVPQALIDYEGPLRTEADLIRTIWEEGLELVQMAHSDRSDWDRYVSSDMYHAIRWLKENPGHPDRQRRLESHRRWQDMYVGYRLKLQGCVALLMTTV